MKNNICLCAARFILTALLLGTYVSDDLVAVPQTPAAPTLPGGMPTLIVDAKTANAQGWLHLHNPTRAELEIDVAASDFTSETTGRPLGAQTTFFIEGTGTGTPVLKQVLKAGQTLAVRVHVSGLSQAGLATATLTINGTTYTMRALALDVPFNVALTADATSADRPQLSFERGRRGLIVIKNDDAASYPIHWRLFVPGEGKVVEGSLTLSPRSSVPVPMEAPGEWFRRCVEGMFKEDVRAAYVTLGFAPGGSTAEGPLATRSQAVDLKLAYWSDTFKSIVGNLLLFLILLGGGLCSLYLGLSIPNQLARIDLMRRLDAMMDDIRALSAQVDSSLRVSLRVERLRLRETLKSVRAFSADSPEKLKQLDLDVQALRRRVGLVARLDEVVQRLGVLRHSTSAAPPTRIDEAEHELREATRLLCKPSADETHWQKAESIIQSAGAQMEAIVSEDQVFAQERAKRMKGLREEFSHAGDIGKRPICHTLRKELPDLFDMFKKINAKYENSAEITPDKYHWLDTSIEKLFVLRHFIFRFDDTEADDKRHNRVVARQERLLQYLRLQNWNALELARNLKRQIEQDIFVEDIEKQPRDGRARIEYEPLTVYANAPTRLHLRFVDPQFNECAARRELACTWNFGSKVAEEEGWDVVHYFRNKDEAKITVTLRNLHDPAAAVITTLQREIPVQPVPPAPWISDRNKVEVSRLALALLVALLALLVGAREQLLKLDIVFGLIAVFLVGFGADSIKNLFARRP